MDLYLVGGAVRDRLLGRPVHERDWVVTGATVDEMLALGFRRKDPNFPVFTHPLTGEEHALARRERKHGHGHKDFLIESGPDVSLDEDLARRDLTVNAIAQDRSGMLIDPFDGARDLEARRLRHVTAAFVEDPLRVLRLARFAAELASFGFQVDLRTAELATAMSASADLATLSAGRTWRETSRALAATAPQRYFECLRQFGALRIVLPWLVSTRDPDGSGAIDALERVTHASTDLAIRTASLMAGAYYGGGAPGLPGQEWPIPAAARALATMSIRRPLPALHDVRAVMAWMEANDAWRRRERFDHLITLWKVVSPERERDLGALAIARDASLKIPGPGAQDEPGRFVRQAREVRVAQSLASNEDLR